MSNITIKISDHPALYSEHRTEAHVDSKEDAIAYLWALAKQDIPQYGVTWLPLAVEPMTNIAMFDSEPPLSLLEKINHFKSNLNEQSIEGLVVQGLNTVFEALGRYGNDAEFIEKVTSSAQDWAKDCYQ